MEYSCFGMHIFFLVCNWAIIAMKHRCAKFTNSGFNKAAVCIFNMLDRTLFNLNFKCQRYNKRSAGDSYHWSDLVYLKPLTMLTRARNHFSRLDLHSAVCSLFVLFFSPLFPYHLTHLSALHQGMHFFSHASVLLTGSDCMRGQFVPQSCRGPCLAWMPMNNIVWREEIKNAGL